MASYRPELNDVIPLILLTPNYVNKSGVETKTFLSVEEAIKNKDNLFFGTFKTYGGTERDTNGIYSIEDTANIKTWYRPDIKSECRIARANDGAIFEIINEPEDVNQRHQFLLFKVKRIKGNA